MCLYYSASWLVADIIISAICRLIGLNDLREYHREIPYCVALSTLTHEEFVEKYPGILGFNNYEEMVDILTYQFNQFKVRAESDLQNDLKLLMQDKPHEADLYNNVIRLACSKQYILYKMLSGKNNPLNQFDRVKQNTHLCCVKHFNGLNAIRTRYKRIFHEDSPQRITERKASTVRKMIGHETHKMTPILDLLNFTNKHVVQDQLKEVEMMLTGFRNSRMDDVLSTQLTEIVNQFKNRSNKNITLSDYSNNLILEMLYIVYEKAIKMLNINIDEYFTRYFTKGILARSFQQLSLQDKTSIMYFAILNNCAQL